MKKIFSIFLSGFLFSLFISPIQAQNPVNNNITQSKEAKIKLGEAASKFKRFDKTELNTLLDRNFPMAKSKNLLLPFVGVIDQISPNNFLFGKEDYSRKLLSALEKAMPQVPDLIAGVKEEMSSLDILVQIAKNMSNEKVLQDSGMGTISEADLAVYADVFEAVSKAEGKPEKKSRNILDYNSILQQQNLSPDQIKNLLK